MNFKKHYIVRGIVFLFISLFCSFGIIRYKKKIAPNQTDTFLKKGDYGFIFQPYSEPTIWTIQIFNNYSHQLSLVTSKWDTVFNLPSGTPIIYSFWKKFNYGYQQITNLSNVSRDCVLVSCFSPAISADKIIETSGSVSLKSYQSAEYYSTGMTTVRISSYNNSHLLVYCAFGNDSIVPVALNTTKSDMPNFYKNIKNIKIIKRNNYEFRGRWQQKKLFFVALPYLKDSVKIDFFPG